jgi:signal transduction histidine kinase
VGGTGLGLAIAQTIAHRHGREKSASAARLGWVVAFRYVYLCATNSIINRYFRGNLLYLI